MIIFLNFNNCYGNTINNLFNNYLKYPNNKNGSPYNIISNKIIEYWKFPNKKLENFITNLINNNIQFISMECNFFKDFYNINLKNIELITCFREPYERFRMNFFKTKKLNHNIMYWKNNFNNFKVVNNKYNYYVRMLNGLGDNPSIKINRYHLQNAKNILNRFRTILIFENEKSFDLLLKYKITVNNDLNKNTNNNKFIISRNEFIKYNKYDYELYNYAKQLSNQQIKKFEDNELLIHKYFLEKKFKIGKLVKIKKEPIWGKIIKI